MKINANPARTLCLFFGFVLAAAIPMVATAQVSLSQSGAVGETVQNPPHVGPAVPDGVSSLTQSLSNAVTPGNSVACLNQINGSTANSYLRRFFLAADHGIITPFSVDSVDFGIESVTAGGAGACAGNPVDVNIYSIPTGAAFTFANMNLVETVSLDIAGTPAASILNVPLPGGGSVNPNTDDLVVEMATCDHSSAGDGGFEFIGSNALGQTQPSYLAAASCGITNPATTSAIGFPNMQIVMTVNGTQGEGEPRATFAVNKDFDDNNPASVEVTISCNTGLPLQQTTTIEEGDGVVFVVVDYEDGAMDCDITEVGVDGYTASYFDGTTTSGTGCTFEAVAFSQASTCNITNSLEQVEVEVTKVWIDENPQYNAQNIADAYWYCSNVAFDDGAEGFGDSGVLNFYGNPAVDSFYVYPSWNGGTFCSVTEVSVLDSGIEIDDSDCDSVVVFPGEGGSCTIYNTRLYEGIPTLSQYGLAVLVLLMLGVGLVGFRRFV